MITKCYVDGSFRPQGSAAAIVIYQNQNEILRLVKPVAAQSSMAAECEAVLLGLLICYSRNFPQPTIYTDSKTLYNHYKGNARIKNKTMAQYIYAMQRLEKIYPFQLINVKRSGVFIPDDMCKNFIEDGHAFWVSNKGNKQ